MSEELKYSLIIATGLTVTQLRDREKTNELIKEMGIECPEVSQCYLCKRKENEESVLVEQGEDTVYYPAIELNLHTIEIREGVKMGFRLCSECEFLLNVFRNKSTTIDL